jgi:hypothetical protein
MKKIWVTIVVLNLITSNVEANPPQAAFQKNRHTNFSQPDFVSSIDQKLLAWIKSNVSPETGLPLSFHIPFESKKSVYQNMGEQFSVGGIVERMIVEEGLIIYDGALRQIVLTMLGDRENLDDALRLTKVLWEGSVGEMYNLRAGFEMNGFIYDPKQPEAVSSDLSEKGNRGFVFRIINANGRYNTEDPMDGKTEFKDFPTWPTVHWEDWKPIAGENAWVAMAALQLYHKKYVYPASGKYLSQGQAVVELQFAQELARAALLLQAENGGIRMAPIGTYLNENDHAQGWYNLVSTENNLSWYAAFRMLYKITENPLYQHAMERLEGYFRSIWNAEGGYFYQGARYKQGQWQPEAVHFATDVQTWSILVLGPEKIDQWFGDGAAFHMWEATKEKSGSRDSHGRLCGVGFIAENDRVSVEWTAGAIFAARRLAEHYEYANPEFSKIGAIDAEQMRQGIEQLRFDLPNGQVAYSYSSKRGWIPFGWYSHDPEVLSLASSTWVVLLDSNYNPFYLSGDSSRSKEFEIAQADFTR